MRVRESNLDGRARGSWVRFFAALRMTRKTLGRQLVDAPVVSGRLEHFSYVVGGV